MAESDAAESARAELLPLLEALCGLAEDEGEAEQGAFFERIRSGVAAAREPDDLAGPFMELSTAAFRGFLFSPPVHLLLDRVLAAAQTFSTTLSAGGDQPH